MKTATRIKNAQDFRIGGVDVEVMQTAKPSGSPCCKGSPVLVRIVPCGTGGDSDGPIDPEEPCDGCDTPLDPVDGDSNPSGGGGGGSGGLPDPDEDGNVPTTNEFICLKWSPGGVCIEKTPYIDVAALDYQSLSLALSLDSTEKYWLNSVENQGIKNKFQTFLNENKNTNGTYIPNAKNLVQNVIKTRLNSNLTEAEQFLEFSKAFGTYDPALSNSLTKSKYEEVIKKYAKEFRRRGKVEFANYLEALLPLDDSYSQSDYVTLYETIRKQKLNLFFEYFFEILDVTYDSFEPVIEMALWEVGGSFALKTLSKLPIRYLTTPIKNVIKRLKIPSSSAFSKLKHAKKYGIKTYKKLGEQFKKLNVKPSDLKVEKHHLFEKRFVKQLGDKLGKNTDDWLSIVVDKIRKTPPSEHYIFTQAWKKAIGTNGKAGTTGFHTGNAPYKVIIKTAQDIYKNYPEILKALGI